MNCIMNLLLKTVIDAGIIFLMCIRSLQVFNVIRLYFRDKSVEHSKLVHAYILF